MRSLFLLCFPLCTALFFGLLIPPPVSGNPDRASDPEKNGQKTETTRQGSTSSTNKEDNQKDSTTADSPALPEPGSNNDTEKPDESDLSSSGSSEQRLRSIEQHLNKISGRLDRLYEQLSLKDSKIETLRQQLQMVKQKEARQSEQLSGLRDEQQQLRKQVTSYREKWETARSSLEDLKKQNEQLENKYQQLQKKYNTQLGSSNDRSELKKKEKKIEALQEEIQSLKKQLGTTSGNPSTSRDASSEETSSTNTEENSGTNDETDNPTTTSSNNSNSSTPKESKPHHIGSIISITRGKVVTNLFGKHGVKKGSTLYVVQDGETLGRLKVTNVYNDEQYPFSFAVPKDKSLIEQLSKDMEVHTKPPGKASSVEE